MVNGFVVVTVGSRGRTRVVSHVLETPAGAITLAEMFRKDGRIAWAARSWDRSRVEVVIKENGEMAAERRVYVVDVAGSGGSDMKVSRLVSAAQPAQAIRHVARGMISARVGKQRELIDLAAQGVTVEEAGD